MVPPRILIIGKNGQVGWELRQTLAPLGELMAVDHPEIDLAQADSLRQWMRDTRPQIVVNAAAYTAVDKAEKEEGLATRINGVAPGILAEEAKAAGALLVHYSTDYVFDGAARVPYAETDNPAPQGAYGRSKLAGDLAVQQVDGPHLIFRLCWVYGTRGANFMLTMMRLARERETLRVVDDQHGTPTWSRMIAETTALALQQVLKRGDFNAGKGLYHLSSAGHTTWRQFAQKIVEFMPAEGRKCARVEPITTAEYPTPARRPAYSVMSCQKLKATFGLQLPTWEDSLRMALDKLP